MERLLIPPLTQVIIIFNLALTGTVRLGGCSHFALLVLDVLVITLLVNAILCYEN